MVCLGMKSNLEQNYLTTIVINLSKLGKNHIFEREKHESAIH